MKEKSIELLNKAIADELSAVQKTFQNLGTIILHCNLSKEARPSQQEDLLNNW